MNVINICLAIVGTINLVLGWVVYSKDKKSKASFYFLFLAFAISSWCFTMYFFRNAYSNEVAEFWCRLLYMTAACIPVAFLFFTFLFLQPDFEGRSRKTFVLVITSIIIVLCLIPKIIVKDVVIISGGENIIYFSYPLYILYIVHIIGIFLWSFIVILKKFLQKTGVAREQLKFIIFGTLIATTVGVITNLILPTIGIFVVNWLGQVFTITMVAFITYAILKHHLFNIKIVATEIFVGLINIVLLIDALLSPKIPSTEFFLKIVVFLLMVFFSIMLIRSVLKEEKHKVELEKIAKELRAANVELRQLDKTKSEFISIASHQLLTPLTPIKGYSAMLLSGDYGDIPKKQRDVLQMIYGSSKRLVGLVSNLLDISRIERGTVEYNFVPTPIDKIVHGVVDELTPIAKKKKLKIIYNVSEEKIPSIFADGDKIREVMLNLVDNAIKYTLKGDIKVDLKLDDGFVLISVKDKGIGMNASDMPKLFKKFSRSEAVKSIYVSGSGLGLYVAGKHVEAHHGQIWAESPGREMGSTFFVRLPIHKRRAG